jgi:UDP-N-acetylmuramoyl-L-alanyl-D-glutamate--2,6-diaminopimelate ligase
MAIQLKDLFPQVKTSREVTGLFFDSRKVLEDGVFFAVVGTHQDGHAYLKDAVEKGAQALVVEKTDLVPSSFSGAVIVVAEARKALADSAKIFFGHPEKALTLLGVTGTNGKTTCVYMLEEMLRFLGASAGVMGTIDHHLGARVWKSGLTTPDVVGVYSRLEDFRQGGATHAAMEVSSHALDQKRVEGLSFDGAIWTNLTRDHLDYHGTMEEYFAAKEKLFLHHLKPKGFALVNGDGENLKEVQVTPGAKLYRYGQNGDFRFSKVQMALEGSTFEFESSFGQASVSLGTPGFHNVSNATAVLAAGLCLGYPLARLKDSLAAFKGAPGRLQLVHRSPFAFVDYAHTPDALASSLKSLKRLLRPDQKITAVFGFGGDRDVGKRPLMVKEALKWADQIVLTSDNPRSEDPEKIIRDGIQGLPGDLLSSVILCEVDRKKAIHLALRTASADDVILVAGKGHEDYQIIGERVLPFSDKQVIEEFFGG